MLTEHVEWESDDVRLVVLGGLPIAPNWPKGQGTSSAYHDIPNRRVEEVIVHHSGGNLLSGQTAPLRIAQFCVARPKYELKDGRQRLVGGGRGWPGIAYTFVVPARPAVQDGRLVVYRCWPDTMVSWHTGAGHNTRGVGVCVAGSYRSRHVRGSDLEPKPDATAMVALEGLVVDYLLPRYGITPKSGLLGHFDAGKPTCPGDFLEFWVRGLRGEAVDQPDAMAQLAHAQGAALDGTRARQGALASLGYHLGPAGVDGVWGHDSRGALEAFQADERLVADGVWGPITEARVTARLAALTA